MKSFGHNSEVDLEHGHYISMTQIHNHSTVRTVISKLHAELYMSIVETSIICIMNHAKTKGKQDNH
jgi:hypothetical protein